MKTKVTDSNDRSAGRLLRNGFRLLPFALCLSPFAFSPPPCLAALPLPDSVIYGTIALAGRAVSVATHPEVTVEARRTRDGVILARHRMGDGPAAGPLFYVLRVPMETAPAASSATAVAGDEVSVAVTSPAGRQFQETLTLATAGRAARLDFGVTVDTGGNGLPDGWETTHFGQTGVDAAADPDADGRSNLAEYLAGTDPRRADSVLSVSITPGPGRVDVSFQAQRAAGMGYEFRQRFYALETVAELGGDWRPVPNFSHIAGADQAVTYLELSPTNAAAFFRARAWLEGP